jgi:hypothetical protein
MPGQIRYALEGPAADLALIQQQLLVSANRRRMSSATAVAQAAKVRSAAILVGVLEHVFIY